MNTFVKDETTQEVPIIEYIKQNDSLCALGHVGHDIRLSIGKQAIAAARVWSAPINIKGSESHGGGFWKSKEKGEGECSKLGKGLKEDWSPRMTVP